jgi:PAS domain S-box-containing protein
MSDLYDNAPDIFISVEVPSGNVVKCNHKTTNVLGYSKEEVIGKQATELYHEYSESAAAAAFEKFKINGEVSVDYLLLKHKNGHGIAVSLNASAVKDDQGNICYSRSILRELDQ